MRKHEDATSKIYWGFVLIVIGGLFLARNLGYIDFQFTMKRYWPLFMIILGLSVVVKSISRKQTN